MAPAESSPRSLVGAVLSRRWRLAQRLGDGGMGEVYAADALEGGARVAVKILRPEYLTEPNVLARFLEEASTCMRLIHPNIVRMLECASAEDGSPYLVMELLEGVPLGAYTAERRARAGGAGGPHPPGNPRRPRRGARAAGSSTATSSRTTCSSPGRRTGTFVVKVLDFGIAKVMDAAGGMGSRTRTGMLLGTPAYMSPEQVKNARDVDQRADLWSAGVMFYEMLTGREAFPAPTEYARLAAVLAVEPEPLVRVDPSLASLAPFLARALQKNRDERFPSALGMARALGAAVPHLAQRLDGGIGKMTPATALPLSRLPEVASVFTPSLLVPTAPQEAYVPRTASTPAPRSPATEYAASPARAPGGTLQSPAGSQRPVADPAPFVMMLSPQTLGETLPSKDLPMIARPPGRVVQGAPAWTVVVLVLVALVAGFLLGWAFARMT